MGFFEESQTVIRIVPKKTRSKTANKDKSCEGRELWKTNTLCNVSINNKNYNKREQCHNNYTQNISLLHHFNKSGFIWHKNAIPHEKKRWKSKNRMKYLNEEFGISYEFSCHHFTISRTKSTFYSRNIFLIWNRKNVVVGTFDAETYLKPLILDSGHVQCQLNKCLNKRRIE